MERERTGALVRRHEEIAAAAVCQEQAAAGAGPQVEPAIVDVQDEDAAGTQETVNVGEQRRATVPPSIRPSVLNRQAA